MAATLGSVPATPPVAQSAQAGDSLELSMRVELTEVGRGVDTGIGPYLRARLDETWPERMLRPSSPQKPESARPAQRLLRVWLEWGDDTHFSLRIEEAGDVLAERAFDCGPPDERVALLLSAWLFVRSSLLRAFSLEHAAGPAPVDVQAQPTHETPPGGPKTAGDEGRVPVASVGFLSLVNGRRTSWVGVSAGLELPLLAALRGSLSLGYAYAVTTPELRIHHLPASLRLAWAAGRRQLLQLGLLCVADGKRAAVGDESKLALGLSFGPELQLSWPGLSARGRDERPTFALLRVSFLWQALRQRYLLATETVRESLWGLGLGLGMGF